MDYKTIFSCTCKHIYIHNYNYRETLLSLYQPQNFRLVRIKINCRRPLENIMGKGENVGYHHFLLFLQCFQKAFSLGSLKPGLFGLKPESV